MKFTFKPDITITTIIIKPHDTLRNTIDFYAQGNIVDCIDDERTVTDIIDDAQKAFPNASIKIESEDDGILTFIGVNFSKNFNMGNGANVYRFTYEDGNHTEMVSEYVNELLK
jgi:hypothetical protein